MNNEPVAVFIPAPLRHDEWKRRFTLNWIAEEPIGITHLYSEELVRQQQAEILAGKIMIKGYSKTIDEQQAEIEALKKQCALLQEGYNAQAILLGVETGLTPDFFFMENDLMGKR